MTPSNFLEQLQWLQVGGNGFNKQVLLPPNSIATTGTRSTASNSLPGDAIILDANGEDAIPSLVIPLDYDQEADLMDLSLVVRLESGTSLTVQPSAVTRSRVGTAPANESGFTAPAATLINASAPVLVQANLSGLTWLPGDVFAVNYAAAAVTGVGVGHVIGALLTYRSVLVAYSDANRGNDLGTSTDHLN